MDSLRLKKSATKINREMQSISFRQQIQAARMQAEPLLEREAIETTSNMDTAISQRFFHEMISNHQIDPHRHTYSPLTKDLSSLLWSISAQCYQIIQQLLPLPSPTTLKKHSSPRKKLLARQLTHLDEMPDVIKESFATYPTNPEKQFPAVFGFDATRASSPGISLLPGEYCCTVVLLPVEPWFPDQVLHMCPHTTGLIDGHVNEIHQLIVTACRSAGIRIVASATDGERHTQTTHANVFKQFESFLPTQELDEISRHFVGKMEHWAVTDFSHAAKHFWSWILKYRLSEEEGSPDLVANDLQSILDVSSVLSDSTDFGAIKDEYPLSLFSLSSLLRIAETMGDSGDDIPLNLPFTVYILTGFTF
jgi:hypothetical protein